MKRIYISIFAVIILIISGAAMMNIKSRESPETTFKEGLWTENVLNNSFLIEHSDSIVTGQVIKILPSRWNTPDGKKPVSTDKMPASKEEFYQKEKEKNIYTDVIIKVDKKIKNKSTPDELIVRTLGGQVGEDIMIVEDEAKFEPGENVLLLLTKNDPYTDNSAGTHYRVTAQIHGKFTITGDNQALRPDLPEPHKKISLEELLNSIGAQ